MTADPPTLLLMAGLPGAGKSTLALAIGRERGWPVLDKDTAKTTLLELGAGEELAGPASYVLLYDLARDIVAGQGLSLVLDTPAFYPRVIETAADICHEAGARLRVILCLAPEGVRNSRRDQRREKPSQSRRRRHFAGDGAGHFDYLPPGSLALQTERPLSECLAAALDYVMSPVSGGA